MNMPHAWIVAGCLTLGTVGTSELLAAHTRLLWRSGGWNTSEGDQSDQITFRQFSSDQCRCSRATSGGGLVVFSVSFDVLFSLNGSMARFFRR